MEILVSDKRLRKVIDDDAACRRQYGADMAKKLALRLASLRAADSLADFWPPKSGPERCHELKRRLERYVLGRSEPAIPFAVPGDQRAERDR